ncbi:Zinc finger, C2H2 [Cordyceps fumosorosea ARSEF 2679]|uniref:Zinc finger, C2H2 n=1 Tax=Cordyceps fumosorosea (strain ARSEF 2679) TaxID=1081104 RepID=A0A167RR04_CORFA|nr:Zinc finger, C2H2 [Cordyceps fumosorosea ARSEF 2679]OAA58844.1 Zinc finger, C2H2 [Cordyceps fumosorosea ARSEF 2679]
MTSPSTTTDRISDSQRSVPYLNLSQQYLAALQAEPTSLAQDLDYDSWASIDFSPEALDSALRDSHNYSHMQSDSTGAIPQFTPNLGRRSHQRESSLSSLGSVGPASPFTQTISNPRIAISDSATELFCEMYNNDTNLHNSAAYHQFAKPMDTFSGYQHFDAASPDMAYPAALPGHMNRPRFDRSLLPAPELNHVLGRSHPASVTSSIAGDSPSTPGMGDIDHADRRRAAYGNIPKLDRTMTDVYGDELYNPGFAITSSSPAHPVNASTTNNQVFSQRLNAANSHHLNAAYSPASTASRGLSPFQATSPYAPPQLQELGTPLGNAQNMGHGGNPGLMGTQTGSGIEPETPKTISPQDAMIEFTAVDGEPSFSLFPESSNSFDFDAYGKTMTQDADASHVQLPSALETHGSQRHYTDIPVETRIPQQYPFVSRAQEIKEITPPPRLGSSGSSTSDAKTAASDHRPSRVGADSGTYTCTYHGCTLRFDTPVQLQKHKREGHRQSQNVGGLRPQENSMAAPVLNTQAGPHRCDRINPSTGKPCSTIFSRPYDLTRHEDTIHNERKHKVQCDLCTVEKTFSRADALTRHYRVCHPEAELPGKHRRRMV